MPWNYRRYGCPTDPVHKSHLNDITGDYGCPTRFRYTMDARAADGGANYDLTRPVSGLAACGTATHETIARVLTSEVTRPRVLAGPGGVPRAQLERAFTEELEREVSGRVVEWYKRDPFATRDECVTMILGLINGMHRYVAEVVLVEPGFIVRLGTHWLSGHIDLLYRPRRDPTSLAIADWKTGIRRPIPIVIDHSWESGVYSVAAQSGWFLRRECLTAALNATGTWSVRSGEHTVSHPSRYIAERECAEWTLSTLATAWESRAARGDTSNALALEGDTRFVRLGRFPSEIYHVHMQDYVPYKRAGRKEITRPEDIAHYQLPGPGMVAYKVGDERGPAWLPVRLTEHDVPRVTHRIRNVVGMIRMGRFIDQIGERCVRCPFAGDCLTGGYALHGDERRDLERVLNAADVSAADDLVID